MNRNTVRNYMLNNYLVKINFKPNCKLIGLLFYYDFLFQTGLLEDCVPPTYIVPPGH